MAVYSENKVLDKFTQQVYELLLKNKFIVLPESFKEISYGLAFKVQKPHIKKSIPVTIYHTEKKGFSFVTTDSNVRAILLSLLTQSGTAGTDEAGKGDFFGPLTVCCFILGKKEKSLLSFDIKDSKKLQPSKVSSIYKHIIKNFPNSYCIVKINPSKYNSLYKSIKLGGGNLNSLLAWAHSTAISNLLKKRNDIKKIVVDQFSSNKNITNIIEKAAQNIPLDFKVRAEQNPAVAVASILARGEYLNELDILSEKLFNNKFKLSSGSGTQADTVALKIMDNYGPEILEKVCKIHFNNFYKLTI